MILKYIILEKGKTAIVFPKCSYSHKDVAFNMGNVISAGFCILKTTNNRIEVKCYGSSSSLNINSHPEIDTMILENMFNSSIVRKPLVHQI